MKLEFNEQEIATILAALRLFQREAATMNMAESFPEHFQEVAPLSAQDIDVLCEAINEGVSVYYQSPECRWNQLMKVDIKGNTPLNRLILHLGYAVEDENLLPENAFDILEGNRVWILDIDRTEDREAALAAYDEREGLKKTETTSPFRRKFAVEAHSNVAYVTREFVRNDCGIHGAQFSDADCDRIIAEVQELAQLGEFHHTDVYWIANRLAAEGCIHLTSP